MLSQDLNFVMGLQPFYTAANSTQMAERSKLIRHSIPEALEAVGGQIAKRIGIVENDLICAGSDGVGQKTPYCWVRFASSTHSPNPRTGWYVVFLFDAVGEGVYLSLNQGTTDWNGTAFVPQNPTLLDSRVQWARKVAREYLGEPGLQRNIYLAGTNGKGLGRAYEHGNVVAFHYKLNSVPTQDVLLRDILFMAECLGGLYRNQDLGRQPGTISPEAAAVLEAASPTRGPTRSRGQGRGLSLEDRKLVELHAMACAESYLSKHGFVVFDTSASKPYDFEAKKNETTFLVEVKGTTTYGESVVLTANEVSVQREAYPNNALIIVHSIDINVVAGNKIAIGGTVVQITPWEILESALTPLTYTYHSIKPRV